MREIFFIILIGYMSYVTAEATGLSAIMTLFCCGFTQSHYAFYNISEDAQKGNVLAINTLGHAAEAFLFAYLGKHSYVIQSLR